MLTEITTQVLTAIASLSLASFVLLRLLRVSAH